MYQTLQTQRKSLGSFLPASAHSLVGWTDTRIQVEGGGWREWWEPRGGSCRRGHLWEGLTEEVLFGLNLAVLIRAAREDAIKWHIIT